MMFVRKIYGRKLWIGVVYFFFVVLYFALSVLVSRNCTRFLSSPLLSPLAL